MDEQSHIGACSKAFVRCIRFIHYFPFSGATDAQKVPAQRDPADRFPVDSRMDIPLLLSDLCSNPSWRPFEKVRFLGSPSP